tara:strand:- start:824 stop:1867 length:1044 start_codon:yes stop_codon:yes gene_type:complete
MKRIDEVITAGAIRDMHNLVPNNCNAAKSRSRRTASCFDDEQLRELRDAWNERKRAKDKTFMRIDSDDPAEIRKQISAHLKNACVSEKCWLDNEFVKNTDLAEKLKKEFAPAMPPKWKTKFNEWLTDRDIKCVLKPLEDEYPEFKLFGPAPIDFNKRVGKCKAPLPLPSNDCKCVDEELCDPNFSVVKLFDEGRTRLGIVLNTDVHTEGGRHWKCVYIEKGVKEVEIYKYDSSKGAHEDEVQDFIERIREELVQSPNYNAYHVHEDENAHTEQKSSSECGMYSLVFLLERVKQQRLPPVDVDSSQAPSNPRPVPLTAKGRPEKRNIYDDLQISQLRLRLFNHHDGHA